MAISSNLSEKFLYKIINHLHKDLGFSEILDAIAAETREFLKIDRVKIYKFAEDGSGQVIAESVFRNLPSLLGLHFPASDIPTLTREEWLYNHQSIIIDVSAQRKSLHQMSTSKLLNPFNPKRLRYISVDPCHIQYLVAMGVLSSLTVPIFYQDMLWGLIAIHHSQPRRFSEAELETIELLSKEVTLAIAQFTLTDQVRQQSYQELTLQKISDTLSQSLPIAQIWQQVLQTIMDSLKADGGQLYLTLDLTGEPSRFYQAGLQPESAFLESHPLWKILMKGNHPGNVLEEKTDLTSTAFPKKQGLEKNCLSYYAITDPDLAPLAEAFTDTPIQSLLFIPLRSQEQWMGCLILFRRDYEYTKSWAGHNEVDRRNTLPRKSFNAWVEIQRLVPAWSSQDLKLGQAISVHLYMAITQQFLSRLINHQSAYDTLTELPNWIIFSQRLTLSLLNAIHQGEMLGVFVIALDRFKRINKNLSHGVGDYLIQQVAARLQTVLESYSRYDPLLSRWHGDGFTLLVTNLSYTDELVNLAQKLLESCREPFHLQSHPLYLTASIGISLAPYDGETSESLLKYAEAALVQAKSQGKNTYQFYRPSTTTKQLDHLSLETDLRKALEREEFLLYYQPQIDLKTGQLVGVEALLRWNHPQLGLVSPVEFIPLAEEMGLIVEIGRWILRTACTDYQVWQKHQKISLILSANLSVRQFQHPDLITDIFQILQETEMNPSNLELEITESLMQDIQGTIAILHQLKNTGIQITIDDFGTGYSSLGKLKYLPIHTLKIDKSFIDDLLDEGKDLAIIQCVINLSKGLNLKVIAEGVETQQQLEKLQLLDCDSAQGYWISRPLPADEMMAFLSNPPLLKIQPSSPLPPTESVYEVDEQTPSPPFAFERYPIVQESIEYLALQEDLRQRSRREKLLMDISQKIRLSLNLDEILNTTVSEVRQFLETDRVVLYQFNPNESGKVVVESRTPDFLPILDEVIHDSCFKSHYLNAYCQGRVSAIANIYESNLAPCHVKLLSYYQVKANLVVPIVYQEKLWGLMIAHHCRSSRQWNEHEIQLLTELSVQVAITIHQGELFRQLESANLKLQQLVSQDYLTQVGNRLYFDESLDKEWKRLSRSQSRLSLILCDIDYFKRFNDHYGHWAGDNCLREVVVAMRSVLKRPSDLIARYGGEEFVVLLPNTDSLGAVHVAQMIRKSVKILGIPHAQSCHKVVTLSLGVTTLIPSQDLQSQQLLASADQALYLAKYEGRDRVCVSC